ncbi:ABC transporter ATP-binding protein [Paenibacillus sp. FSL R7-0273]|uniref:ABC transporter ATP-binding protein n=1 Tax=Paenibacillus sp. FSL R7-0273 TaxID=1536772 RepID=UPI0004F73E86|nr:ABC transporter ATP-binding protein [Paenibacillus sp. FSL R7-0273]AIQ48468.1 ABC transporter ATP-binding protein [Paenibacillus sp. FSL R7-0273]OMF86322.1 ABC transporter ATP-binding protein [Paenibacillus sp. FSL R7-0273]
MKKIIAAEHIVKVYGQGGERRKVLDGVSVSINEGEFVSVMGPSGSGKSTLLFAVSGMDTVDGGRVFFDGRELGVLQENELADLRRRRMGFVFQQPTLLKNMNLLDNIILPAMRDHRKNVKKITERARTLMKKTGIEGLEKRDITQVSGGQLQRAGICRALLGSPQILFGDEPTGALNQEAAEGIMSLFAEINEAGTAVMLVTHDARIAAKTERILFMCDGQIVSEMRLPKFRETVLEERMEQVVLRMRELGI